MGKEAEGFPKWKQSIPEVGLEIRASDQEDQGHIHFALMSRVLWWEVKDGTQCLVAFIVSCVTLCRTLGLSGAWIKVPAGAWQGFG